MTNETGLIRYDAMCRAIVACHVVDEALDIKEKARALEVYAAQSRNTEAERKACDIRMRAERRSGELLAELARATTPNPQGLGGHTGKVDMSNDGTQQAPSPYAEALQRTGLTRQTANRYEQLAAIPAEEFEAALADPIAKPSTARLIRETRDPVPAMDRDSLWLWGTLRDFESRQLYERDAVELIAGMTPTMRADVYRLALGVSDHLRDVWRVAKGESHESA